MPAKMLFDISNIDLDKTIITREEIYQVNPHRYEFMLLDGVIHHDAEAGNIIGYRDTRDDEFWVKGHIPGRPLFPGVLMIEAAAQLVSYFVMKMEPDKGFLGFGGVTDVKFRGAVVPGDRLVLFGKLLEHRSRRSVGAIQGYVGDNQVFQGKIIGMWV
jgi:3-hydroxyacyl-[acyl-carrier-protein] dehydratase